VTHTDPWDDGSATDGTVVINALEAGVEELESESATFVAKSGSTMTGALTLDKTTGAALNIVAHDASAHAMYISPQGPALLIDGAEQSGATVDSIDITHRSTGDGVYVMHLGGHPLVGDLGGTGGNAGFNVLIPAYLDTTGSGWDGVVPNTRTGQQGLFIAVQPPAQNANAIQVYSSSNVEAVRVVNQPTGHPVGNGQAVVIADYGTDDSLHIDRYTSPTVTANASTDKAVVAIVDTLNTTGAIPHRIVRIADSTQNRLVIDSDGSVGWIAHGVGTVYASISCTASGKLDIAGSVDFVSTSPGAWPALGFRHPSATDYVQLGGGGVEVMKFSANGLGFFGAAWTTRRTGTPVAATDLATALTLVNALRTGLINLGLFS
jgi:hypothetical protein